jgi:PilZ domain
MADPDRFYKPGVQPRPHRIGLHVPVRYHVIGDAWYEGWTENLSRTGVLIRSAQTAPLGAEVDLVLSVPPGILNELAGEIICAGAIVRLVDGAEGQPPGFGVALRKCRPTVASRSF